MRIREEIWMKANPLSGGSSCMVELTWHSGVEPEGNFNVADFPSFAISFATAPVVL